MDELLDKLINQGFKAKQTNNRIKVTLGGLANRVNISYDIATKRFELHTNDLIHSLCSALFLLLGLSAVTDHQGLNSFYVVIGSLGFLMVLLTELKVRKLSDYVDSLNGASP
ncbi:hypothetical protein [Psychrobium sp. 1_MG-2023]|uniref:hypothetical protein n=1 Tax=Psychrobium sp. 1_MG-2023 TaxID=3062624 RepID=UPI000C32E450|nr:hypothetical protein [Psychrobium sp. 1_MG-2023]MDP2561505.1 hypothetical protein [Psychrobium sp. 1_MG-2023]PKF57770.1 hypothetical protein CW748_06130 [Alteromonadales bacterium alter-6D02]